MMVSSETFPCPILVNNSVGRAGLLIFYFLCFILPTPPFKKEPGAISNVGKISRGKGALKTCAKNSDALVDYYI